MKKLTQPWFIRKICYLLASIGLAVLAALGLVDEQTGEQVAIAIGTAAGALAPLIAALFTGEHSDEKITTDDVAKAERAGRADGLLASLGIDQATADALISVGKHAAKDTIPQASPLPVYTGPTSAEYVGEYRAPEV
ncbi:hypothetical protein KBX29_03760 [Corynebacterium sp. CCUG 18816]|uniref:hypothetical protein n=1 Tax=Corynebacterium pseudogenitalium TaxID=38303 RepID=UPI0021094254|nr:hypothetical protein [Corynebacterium pseudogenitalium]MCQ4615964.1 hypothetical protein [Corynebacterium pseudogenitalium]